MVISFWLFLHCIRRFCKIVFMFCPLHYSLNKVSRYLNFIFEISTLAVNTFIDFSSSNHAATLNQKPLNFTMSPFPFKDFIRISRFICKYIYRAR